jgi:glycosyltransferase involved in cell wall biosynthesis
MKLLRGRSSRLVFDFDDAIFTTAEGPSHGRAKRFSRIVSVCDRVWAGNSYLAEQARLYNDQVSVLATSIETARYRRDLTIKSDDYFDLAWVGSSSTRRYLEEALPTIAEAGLRVRNLRLKVIADFDLHHPGLAVKNVRWDTETEVGELASSQVGIAPMPDNAWTKGKCACKVLQYMAAGLPVISSACGVNREAVISEVTGLLPTEASQWVAAIERLSRDRDLRSRMGIAGRQRVEEHFSTEVTSRQMSRSLEELVNAKTEQAPA